MTARRWMTTLVVLAATASTAFGAFAAPASRLRDDVRSGAVLLVTASDTRVEGRTAPVADADEDGALTAVDLQVLPDPDLAATAVVVELTAADDAADDTVADAGTARLVTVRAAGTQLPDGWGAGVCSPPPVPRCDLGPGTAIGDLLDGTGTARVQLWALEGAPDLPTPVTVELVLEPTGGSS